MRCRNSETDSGIPLGSRGLISLIPNGVLIEVDNYELTMLAHQFDLFATAGENIVKEGYKQITPNNYSQITADVTMQDKAGSYIMKNAGKVGLNPESRSKIPELWAKKEEEGDDMGDMMKLPKSNVSTTG